MTFSVVSAIISFALVSFKVTCNAVNRHYCSVILSITLDVIILYSRYSSISLRVDSVTVYDAVTCPGGNGWTLSPCDCCCCFTTFMRRTVYSQHILRCATSDPFYLNYPLFPERLLLINVCHTLNTFLECVHKYNYNERTICNQLKLITIFLKMIS